MNASRVSPFNRGSHVHALSLVVGPDNYEARDESGVELDSNRSCATKDVNFLSKRVGNYQFSPDGNSLLIDQLWVR